MSSIQNERTPFFLVMGVYSTRYRFYILYFSYLKMLKTKTLRIVFWHQEVASGPFCLLVNCPWLLVFAQYLFFLFLSAFNLYFWSNKHFSWSLDLVFLFNFFFAVVGLHLYFTDLIRESYKQYEIYIIRSAYSHFSLS